MAQVNEIVTKALRSALVHFHIFLSDVLAGASLVATVILLLILYQIISQTRASYPSLPPITGSSLAKPIFLRSVPIDMPESFRGRALSVSPDGKKVAYWSNSKEPGNRGLFVDSLDTGDGTLIWQYVTAHQWSPDSNKLLLLARQDELGAVGLAVVDVDGTNFDWISLPPDETTLRSPQLVATAAWSPDGKAVLYVQPKVSDGTSELWRVELDNRQRQRLAVLPKEADKSGIYIRKLSVSPDGKKVSFINADRPGAERSSSWWIMNVDGSSPLTVMKRGQGTGFVQNWLWSPDSRQLIFDVRTEGDGNYEPTTLWAMNSDGTARRQISGSDNVEGFALSPKGDWIICGKDNHLWLTNLETGRDEQVTFGDDHESDPFWLLNGDVIYHLRVGSVSSLRLLVHGEPSSIPGLGTQTPQKNP